MISGTYSTALNRCGPHSSQSSAAGRHSSTAAAPSHSVVQNGAQSACCQLCSESDSGHSAGKNQLSASDHTSSTATTA
ncbi:hypothetical protein D9M68_1001990 [compost metagenome]